MSLNNVDGFVVYMNCLLFHIVPVRKFVTISIYLSTISLIVAQWCPLASAILVNIGSDNGLLAIWCQAIIQTNTDLLAVKSLATNFYEIWIIILIFFQENAFENVFC